ncbi:MAG: glutathione S-transferase family protein [Solirubrobacteraceae bacterium]
MYKLYVIPGSHACRSAMLMLEHKQQPYRRVEIPTLMHPLAVRLHGFDAGGQTRTAGSGRPLALRVGDHLGTVPALAANGDRISTNYRIARFLDERHPDRPLFPADPAQRARVEEAEDWANERLQMVARRILLPVALRDPSEASQAAGQGRLGHLLYRQELARRLIIPMIGRVVFNVGSATEQEMLGDLPGMLDRIDAWIADGVLGGPRLNAADFMVAPSLALILYRPDVAPLFAGRPALELVDRLLPEPLQPAAAG